MQYATAMGSGRKNPKNIVSIVRTPLLQVPTRRLYPLQIWGARLQRFRRKIRQIHLTGMDKRGA